MICVASNDQILHTVTKQMELGPGKTSPAVSLADLNEYISQGLASMFLPVHPVNLDYKDKKRLSMGYISHTNRLILKANANIRCMGMDHVHDSCSRFQVLPLDDIATCLICSQL